MGSAYTSPPSCSSQPAMIMPHESLSLLPYTICVRARTTGGSLLFSPTHAAKGSQ